MNKVLAIFIISICLGTVNAGRMPRDVTLGRCYGIKTSPQVNLTALSTGKWYEISKYYNDFEGNSDCTEQTFDLDTTNKNFTLHFSIRLENGAFSEVQSFGYFTITSDEIVIDTVYSGDESVLFSFDVLATDYTSYAVTYSCYQVTNGLWPVEDERLWVLSRTRTLSSEAELAVNDALIIDGTDLGALLYKTNQKNCALKNQ